MRGTPTQLSIRGWFHQRDRGLWICSTFRPKISQVEWVCKTGVATTYIQRKSNAIPTILPWGWAKKNLSRVTGIVLKKDSPKAFLVLHSSKLSKNPQNKLGFVFLNKNLEDARPCLIIAQAKNGTLIYSTKSLVQRPRWLCASRFPTVCFSGLALFLQVRN